MGTKLSYNFLPIAAKDISLKKCQYHKRSARLQPTTNQQTIHVSNHTNASKAPFPNFFLDFESFYRTHLGLWLHNPKQLNTQMNPREAYQSK